jgi:hypothetical protein
VEELPDEGLLVSVLEELTEPPPQPTIRLVKAKIAMYVTYLRRQTLGESVFNMLRLFSSGSHYFIVGRMNAKHTL